MRPKQTLAAVVVALTLLAGVVNLSMASTPSGVTPTVLARGSFPAFKVMSAQGPGMFKAEAKAPIDAVVRRHVYAPGGSTGWHSHPYPVLITVIEGQLTFYDYNDPTCTPTVVSAGQGYVDSGGGHLGRNETGLQATDISVILAPVGGAFRGELTAPGPYCDF